jgi:TolB-like protein/Flp pilus assembly protein TadD
MATARIKFGGYELDPGAFELSRGGHPLKIERIPLDLLMLLIERRGELVTRDEIVGRLWGKDVFLDIDNGINTAIRKLRRILNDNPERSAFIKTVAGRGYRFVALVSAGGVPAGAETRAMLAVLPFENLSSDPEQEYFSDGLTEETIARLGQMQPERLGVIARTSSMTYKHTTKGIDRIGRELGVDYVLESSVRREGRRVRITSQLIRVKDQTHLWADTYDRDMTSFLGVQNELGQAIAQQVQIQLAPQSLGLREHTQDAEAYDLYLRGRYYWNQLTPIGIQRGIGYFQDAVARDPNYALAYAGLAECYAMLPITCDAPPLDVFPKAMAAATKAVDLDASLAEAHAAVGSIKMWMEWDWAGAEIALRRAIELNPNYVMAHRWYGHLLSDIGRHAESAEELTKARQVDPLSPIMHALSGHLRYHAREYDVALQHVHKALAIAPGLWVVHTFLARIYERKGMLEEALEAAKRAFELSGGNTEQISLTGYIHARMGNRAAALEAIRILREPAPQKYVSPYNIALVYGGLNEVENALLGLEQSYDARDVRLTFLAVEPKWDFLRGHPQFQDLIRRMAFPS